MENMNKIFILMFLSGNLGGAISSQIRAGHVRSACEVNNAVGCQQHEPAEAGWQNTADRSRNPRPLGQGGCQ